MRVSTSAQINRLAHDDARLTRFLNNDLNPMLITDGIPLSLDGDDGSQVSGSRVNLFNAGVTYLAWEFDPATERIKQVKFEIDQVFLEQMLANTRDYRNGNEIPVHFDHSWGGEARGWIHLDKIEVTAEGMFATPDYFPETRELVDGGRYKYGSCGWSHKQFDYRSGKNLGPVIHKWSLFQSTHPHGVRLPDANLLQRQGFFRVER